MPKISVKLIISLFTFIIICVNISIKDKYMKKVIMIFCLILLFGIMVFGQTDDTEPSPIGFKLAFHDIGWNALHSITYNYGLNFAASGLITFGAIESGFDSYCRDFAYDNHYLSNLGFPILAIGMFVPALTPLVLYRAGENNQNPKLQITALALTQSLILTLAIQSPMKMITGRQPTNIMNGTRADDDSRKFDWFNMDFGRGWPSGHTATAVSAAATIAEMYNDNTLLKIGVYSYAAFVGFGMAVSVHWASDVLAGALIGYAIGKTVGRSFNRLLEKGANKDNDLSFYFFLNTAGVTMRL